MTELNEKELAVEQKQIDRARRLDTANAEKKRRESQQSKHREVRKTARKRISVALDDDALLPQAPAAAAEQAGPPVPAAQVAMAAVPQKAASGPPLPAPSAPPPPPPATGEAKGALLGSIQGFSKQGLKKAVTKDRSGPVL